MKVSPFNTLFNPDARCRSFISRAEVDYVIELADAYTNPNDVDCADRLRTVLAALDSGCPTVKAIGACLSITGNQVQNRVRKFWRIALRRRKTAMNMAFLDCGYGSLTPTPHNRILGSRTNPHTIRVHGGTVRSCSNYYLAAAWMDGFNYAKRHGTESCPQLHTVSRV